MEGLNRFINENYQIEVLYFTGKVILNNYYTDFL